MSTRKSANAAAKAAQTAGVITVENYFAGLDRYNQRIRAGYLGRAVARLSHGKFDLLEDGSVQHEGGKGETYITKDGVCHECEEWRINAAAMVEKLHNLNPRHCPGLVCKHTVLDLGVRGELDLYALVDSIAGDTELLQVVNNAMNREEDWMAGRRTPRNRTDGRFAAKNVAVVQVKVKQEPRFRNKVVVGDDGFAYKQYSWLLPDGMSAPEAIAKVRRMFPDEAYDIYATKVTQEFVDRLGVAELS